MDLKVKRESQDDRTEQTWMLVAARAVQAVAKGFE